MTKRATRACSTALLAAIVAWLAVAAGRHVTAAGPASSTDPIPVRITSPLGRTGFSGRVRIVAQIQGAPDVPLQPVKFYVDDALVGVDDDGAPYMVEWTDENPFEPRELRVEVADRAGRTGRASLTLPAFEVTEITDVRSVLIEAAVYDRRGRFVPGLPPSAFHVSEDGASQQIDLVAQETVPATFALLVDNSQSMSRRMDFVRDAAARLAASLRPNDRVLVAPFNRTLGVVTGPTDDRQTVAQAIGVMRAGGGTAIVDALIQGVDAIAQVEGRRAVIVLTDGYDENSTQPPDAVLEHARRAGVTIYVVGIGGVAGVSLKGERLLRRFAAGTGGQVFFPARDTELAEVCGRIAADAHTRYLITYTPANQRADGRWRRIDVAADGEYAIKSRDGYLAPRPAPIRPMIEFTVADRQRGLVQVTAGDVAVFENGVEQTVDSFQEAVEPVSIVLALDSSGSMKRAAPVVVQTASDFVQSLRPADSLALITFADTPTFAHVLALNREWTLDAIGKYQAAGGTALYDALTDALMHLKEAPGRRAVVVVTDGRDENNAGTAAGSRHTLPEVLALIKETGATVFAIGIGQKVDKTVLIQLARESGGEAYLSGDATELSAQYRRLVDNLRQRFVLSYTSTNGDRDGSWRAIEIRPRVAELLVTSRRGYFAPAQ